MTAKLPLVNINALVTGGGSGIGLACAESLYRDGANVTLMGRSEQRLAEARAVLEAIDAPGLHEARSFGHRCFFAGSRCQGMSPSTIGLPAIVASRCQGMSPSIFRLPAIVTLPRSAATRGLALFLRLAMSSSVKPCLFTSSVRY